MVEYSRIPRVSEDEVPARSVSHHTVLGRSEESASLYVSSEDVAAHDLPPIFPPHLRPKPTVGNAMPRRVQASYFDSDAGRDIQREYPEYDDNREPMVLSEDMEHQDNVTVQSSGQLRDEVVHLQTPESSPVDEISDRRRMPPRKYVQYLIN